MSRYDETTKTTFYSFQEVINLTKEQPFTSIRYNGGEITYLIAGERGYSVAVDGWMIHRKDKVVEFFEDDDSYFVRGVIE